MKKNIHTSRIAFLFVILLASAFNLSPIAARAELISSVTLSSVVSADSPMYLYIPSINLFSNMQGVGIDKKGNMDVPSGKTNNVGWYEYGTMPGNTGTAVLDAHNTAAFKNLKNVPVGSDIYILTQKGKIMHFVVREAQVYSMKTLKPSTLFAQAGHPQINLITCAGKNLGGGDATHRLIVSAQLV